MLIVHMAAPDLTNAHALYWSPSRADVPATAVREAWAAAAASVWKDEFYVDERCGALRADYLYNSGHVRFSVCECALLLDEPSAGSAHFLTVVETSLSGVNLGWAIHTRALDRIWGDDWMNPWFGEHALRNWASRQRL